MKRYYSHYIYIYPDIFMKNCVIEMDDKHRIIHIFQFKKEVEKTEFYSGLLLFLPEGTDLSEDMFTKIKDADFKSVDMNISSDNSYYFIHREDLY